MQARSESTPHQLLSRAIKQAAFFADAGGHSFSRTTLYEELDGYRKSHTMRSHHSNIKMTERYAKLAKQHIARTSNTAREMWKLLERSARKRL
jgi:hypothetical protein